MSDVLFINLSIFRQVTGRCQRCLTSMVKNGIKGLCAETLHLAMILEEGIEVNINKNIIQEDKYLNRKL